MIEVKVGIELSKLDTLGSRIRKIREMKQHTREEVCGDETELSIRQLARIEKGESVPSLVKLTFIAKQLDTKVEALLDLAHMYEYCQLKSQLELYAIDYDTNRNVEIDQSLSIIYEYYYDDFPIEEQMYIDCSAISHEIRQKLDPKIATKTLEKYSNVLISKELYSSNELAYIALYTRVVCLENKEIDIDRNIINIHKKIETEDQLSIELSIRTQVNIASYFYYQEKYDDCLEMLKQAEKMANEKKTFQRMPIIYMLKAKCLKVFNQKDEAKYHYQNAIQLAQMLQLKGLETNLKQEYQNDFVNSVT